MSYDLSDYVEVKDRLVEFYAKHPTGSIESRYEFRVVNGKDLVVVSAQAFRSPDDLHPATGLAAEIIPGSTSFTRGAELENAQTSAWGRALGALGIGVKGAIASAEEVAQAKARQVIRRDEARQAAPKVERVSQSDQATVEEDPWATLPPAKALSKPKRSREADWEAARAEQGSNAAVAVVEGLLGGQVVEGRPHRENHKDAASAAQVKFVRNLIEPWAAELGQDPLDLLNAWLDDNTFGPVESFDEIGWNAAKPLIDALKGQAKK